MTSCRHEEIHSAASIDWWTSPQLERRLGEHFLVEIASAVAAPIAKVFDLWSVVTVGFEHCSHDDHRHQGVRNDQRDTLDSRQDEQVHLD